MACPHKKYRYFNLLTLFITALLFTTPAQAAEWQGKLGDGNGDDIVDIRDVIYVINIVLNGTGTANGSDCNQDNNVNIQDIICTINIVLNSGSGGNSGTNPLNDTGITTCSDESINNASCPQANQPNQDAQHGRDATHNNDSDGHAGFSFTKLDNSGNDLPISAAEWSCVRDNVTHLIWEVKTDDGGLRDKDWRYSWYNSTGINDGGRVGTENGGPASDPCFDDLNCDTEKFARQVNLQSLCGKSDWRVPSKKELGGLVSFDRINPSIDTLYFPKSIANGYWSSIPHALGIDSAWLVFFVNGGSYAFPDNVLTHIRLVRTEN